MMMTMMMMMMISSPPPSTPGANAYAPTRAVDGARTRFLVSASAPEPVMFPRPTIALAFAVCLLRSSYEAVDECDVLSHGYVSGDVVEVSTERVGTV